MRVRLFIALCLLATALLAQASEQPGGIGGIVTSAHDGAPLNGAFVRARAENREYVGRTGADGRFLIEELPAGQYRVSASKSSYARTRGHYATVSLAPGETSDLELEMLGFPVISGTVTDANGEPAQRKRVAAYEVSFSGGERHLSAKFNATTDDLGHYRFINIGESPMVVRAEGIAAGPTDAVARRVPPSIFYSASNGPEAAQIVRPRAGEVVEGIDLRLPPPVDTALRVSAAGLTSADCRGCNLRLVRHDGTAAYTAYETGIDASSTADIYGLEPGEYTAILRGQGRNPRGNTGETRFAVVRGEPASIAVRLEPQIQLSGRVVFDLAEGQTAPDPRRTPLLLTNLSPWRRGIGGGSARVRWDTETGAFRAQIPSGGRYVPFIEGLQGGYLRSVSVAGRELRDSVLELGPAGASEVIFEYSWATGSVAVSVTGDLAAGTVALLSTESKFRGLSGLASSIQFADSSRRGSGGLGGSIQSGAAAINAVPPGEYVAYATADSDEYNLSDPAVRAQFKQYLEPVTVRAGETARVSVTPLPEKD